MSSEEFGLDTDQPEEKSDEQVDSILDETEFMSALPLAYRRKLVRDYDKWIKEQTFEDISEEQVKDALMKNLTFLSQMGVEEYTLFRKWDEVHRKKADDTINQNSSIFMEIDSSSTVTMEGIKNRIWRPQKPDDYRRLQPQIISAQGSPKLTELWNTLRIFTHTQLNNSNIGRNLYFIVHDAATYDKDLATGKILGIFALSSDFMDLTPRDNYIGWSREIKTSKRMLNHTSICSTICPTQPLGFNYVGGKLIALMSISNVAEDIWNETYDTEKMPSKLAGLTTTSLYSSFSQYQNLSYWSKRGHSAGSIKFEPTKDVLKIVEAYIKKTWSRKYWEWYIATEPGGMPLKRDFRQRSLSFLYTQLKIDKQFTEAKHQRGIYFCPLFKNTNEYLRMEIPEENLIRRFDNSVDALAEIWKEKYAKKRIGSLTEQGRTNLNEILFYDDLLTMTWEQAKATYLIKVGHTREKQEESNDNP